MKICGERVFNFHKNIEKLNQPNGPKEASYIK